MSGGFDFAWAEALAAVGLTRAEYVRDLARITMREGRVVRLISPEPDRPTGSPSLSLLAWPYPDHGLMACLRCMSHPEAPELVGFWPFASRGISCRMQVEALEVDGIKAFTAIRGSVHGVRLSVFDALCECAVRPVVAGETVAIRLHGWASSLGSAPKRNITVSPATLGPELAELVGARDGDGAVELQITAETAAIWPALEVDSPLYGFRGPVKAVRLAKPIMGTAVWVLTVTIARPDEGDLDCEVSVTSSIWSGAAPKVGDSIEGVVWLQASFA